MAIRYPSAHNAQARARPGYAALLAAPGPPAPASPPPAMPAPPAVPAGMPRNPATFARERTLTAMLDPSEATFIGRRYRPELDRGAGDLRQGLAGLGEYDTNADPDSGVVTPRKRETGQPGERYRDAYAQERSAAAAAGMLHSRRADQAVGAAWGRLAEDERAVINQYAAQTSSTLSTMAGEFSDVVGELQGLYGQSIQYALDNPELAGMAAPEPAPEPAPRAPRAAARVPRAARGPRRGGRDIAATVGRLTGGGR